MTAVRFSVPSGFRLEHQTRAVSPDEAVAILGTGRQRRYTSVIRRESDCLLTKDILRCPCCGRSTPAYNRFMKGGPVGFPEEACIPKSEIKAWMNNLSLFTEDNELQLNRVWNGKRFICPHCGMTSLKDDGRCQAEIRAEKGTIRFTVFDIRGIDVSRYLQDAARQGFLLLFPLRETVCFSAGKAWLTVYDECGHALEIRDVSVPNKDWSRSKTCWLLTRSERARKLLAQVFETVWNGPLPYALPELSAPDRFLLLNRHRGFDREFFDMIPTDGVGGIDRSFRTAARRLRETRRLPRVFESSGLPDKKCIRRSLFEMPYLFFFLPELRSLWDVFGNVDQFHAFLDLLVSCDLLLFLHFYPAAEIYFRDYAAVKGARGLMRVISHSEGLEKLRTCALRYAAGSEILRSCERQRWTKGQAEPRRASDYYPPGVRVGIRYRDLIVDGLLFTWLRKQSDFIRAGRALHNCLASYGPLEMRVLGICKGEKALAAVEVRKERIVQAYMAYNVRIDRESSLWASIGRWAELCRFRVPEIADGEFIDVDNFELPF